MEISTYASTDIDKDQNFHQIMSSSTGTGCGFKVSVTKRHSSMAFLIFSAHFVQTLDEYSGVFMTESPRSWDIQCKLVQRPFLDTFSRRNFKQVF